MRWLIGFGRFWYDFIVGDSFVLALGGCAAIIIGVLLAHAGDAAIAQFVLPAAIVGTLAGSLRSR